MEILIAPLFVMQTKKKKFYIGLNKYRNTHFRVLNSTKIKYKKLMKEQILELPPFNKVELIYTLYPRTKGLCDIGNILSIHDKYLCDALVEYKKLPEDNYLHIPKITFLIGKVDKFNPRVEIQIQEIP